jgi:hypothetical protein
MVFRAEVITHTLTDAFGIDDLGFTFAPVKAVKAPTKFLPRLQQDDEIQIQPGKEATNWQKTVNRHTRNFTDDIIQELVPGGITGLVIRGLDGFSCHSQRMVLFLKEQKHATIVIIIMLAPGDELREDSVSITGTLPTGTRFILVHGDELTAEPPSVTAAHLISAWDTKQSKNDARASDGYLYKRNCVGHSLAWKDLRSFWPMQTRAVILFPTTT